MLRLIALALVPLALAAGNAAAGGGGPSPGVVIGWDGTLDSAGAVRYVALPASGATAVAAIRRTDGRVLRYLTVRGSYGIPQVAFDGTTEGVSPDGKTLVLATYAGAAAETSFAVLGTTPLRLRKTVTLPGNWSFDALSPDGTTLYAIEYLGTGQNTPYNVRAVSLVTGRPLGGPIVDKRNPDEEMNGSPVARATQKDGGWAYTLYARPGGTAFVHALSLRGRNARCVDLPWRGTERTIQQVRLGLSADGRSLYLRRAGTRLAAVDTRTFAVSAFARP